ncbi:MAG: hypothetical protein O3C40_16065 [Planctomycetota bacterium]|nr:hypothetical protein [Planctomycetota bacterium]
MDKVKKKVLLDLFGSPGTVLPIVAGMSAWMLSWAVDGSMLLNLGGLVGVLGGVGFLATRLIFGLEKITENAFQYLNDQRREAQEQALDLLEVRLRGDEDPRTQTYLRDLRTLYTDFQDDLRSGRVAGAARTVLEQVEKLFQAAVKHLEHSYHLWVTAGRMSDDARQALLEERERVVQEVQETVEHLSKTIEQFHSFRVKASEAELAKLREELDETMQVARRAEARLESLGTEITHDPREFE